MEYTAERVFGRFGAVVYCSMTQPETIEDQNITKRKRNIYRFIVRNMLAIVLFLCFVVEGFWIGRNIGLSLVMAIVLLPVLVWTFRVK